MEDDPRGARPSSDSTASEVPEPEADLTVRGYAEDFRAVPVADRAQRRLRIHLDLWTARSDGLGHGDEEGGRRPPAPRCAAVGSAPILVLAFFNCGDWDAVGWVTAVAATILVAVFGSRAGG